MNPLLENKLIAEAKKFGFKPDQRSFHNEKFCFIKSKDQFRSWHNLYSRKYVIHLCDRYLKKKDGKIVIRESERNKDGELEILYNGKVESLKFFRQILLAVGCSRKGNYL